MHVRDETRAIKQMEERCVMPNYNASWRGDGLGGGDSMRWHAEWRLNLLGWNRKQLQTERQPVVTRTTIHSNPATHKTSIHRIQLSTIILVCGSSVVLTPAPTRVDHLILSEMRGSGSWPVILLQASERARVGAARALSPLSGAL
ncbi:hypothetical protein PybrP1_009985 [[Pythium] brassicae (nom. inval.)]|nr:hypothetical protein PybrP1_009985 [[Pythium] brassicae (nom. inval.)]